MLASYWSFVIPPLVGAGIGAVTNDVAIRMLFRPYRPWRVGNWQVPLTPGLIPRERHHIAAAIADTFVAHVLDAEAVREMVLTESTRAALTERVAGLVEKLGGMLNVNEAMLGMAKTMAGNYLVEEVGKLAGEAGADGEEIRRRIQQKIDDLDVRTLEELVLGFSRKQFRHITWFGALLGFMIGVVQVGLIHGTAWFA